jgi:hypothetical protein
MQQSADWTAARRGSSQGRSALAPSRLAPGPPFAEEQGSRSDHSRRWAPPAGPVAQVANLRTGAVDADRPCFRDCTGATTGDRRGPRDRIDSKASRLRHADRDALVRQKRTRGLERRLRATARSEGGQARNACSVRQIGSVSIAVGGSAAISCRDFLSKRRRRRLSSPPSSVD